MRKLICLLAMGLFFCGCASVGKPIDNTAVKQIQKGVTTKDEIVKKFGQPDNTYFDKDGRLSYSYYASKIKPSGWTFIPVVNIVHNETNMKTQILTILFSKDGTVEDYSFTNSDKAIKSGIIT